MILSCQIGVEECTDRFLPTHFRRKCYFNRPLSGCQRMLIQPIGAMPPAAEKYQLNTRPENRFLEKAAKTYDRKACMNDTIAAIATAPGSAGLGVIRISGPGALSVAQALFSPARPNAPLIPRQMRFGSVTYGGRSAGDALAVYFPAPHSYTGEDVAELQMHGNPAVLSAVLAAACTLGARPAGRGEFTKRAFLNGRIDLSQAEAVAELIAAPSPEGAALAAAKLDGALGKRIRSLREKIEYVRKRLCLAIDFPEEEGECLPTEEFQTLLDELIAECSALTASYRRALPWTDGAVVALAGKVNAGKSSLMNALLGRNRAIVTPHAGTTRDYLEERTSIEGVPVRLTDTAGIRPEGCTLPDPIEAEGIRRSLEIMSRADLIVLVADMSGLNAEAAMKEAAVLAEAAAGAQDSERKVPVILALNKTDLPGPHGNIPRAEDVFAAVCPISAKTGSGIDRLCSEIRAALVGREWMPDEAAPNKRQCGLIEECLSELSALRAEAGQIPPDIAAVRIEQASASLADVTGLNTAEDTFNAIFEEFCIGK